MTSVRLTREKVEVGIIGITQGAVMLDKVRLLSEYVCGERERTVAESNVPNPGVHVLVIPRLRGLDMRTRGGARDGLHHGIVLPLLD